MKNIVFLLILLSLFSCAQRDNEEFVETGLDFAEKIEKIEPVLAANFAALQADSVPNELKERGILWVTETGEDFEVTCTSVAHVKTSSGN